MAEKSHEELIRELEKVVSELERGELSLTEALQRYEQGVGFLKDCYEALDPADQKIELLTHIDKDGQPSTAPFAEREMSIEEKQASRSKRRSHADASMLRADEGE